MTAIARRPWASVETEVIKRLGNIDSPGFSTRVENWIWQAYQWLSLTYHHFELDVIDTTQKVPIDTNFLLLPDDCHILIAVARRGTDGNPTGSGLSGVDASPLLTEFRGERGAPNRYARFANGIFFNFIGDQPYPLTIYYYRYPVAPDFTSTSQISELGIDLDETIINLSLQLGFTAVGRPDLGDVASTTASTYLSMQPRPMLVSEPLAMRERMTTNRSIGGAQR